MELFDLYDENRIKTGETMVRGDKIPENRYRFVVHVIVFNSEGKMLIQQRTSDRSSHPNNWDFSVGGSVVAGETSSEGATRELHEELGIDVNLKGRQANFSINFGKGFDDYYIIDYDIDAKDVNFQKEEVQAVKWADKDEIISLIRSGEFIEFRECLVDLIFSFRDKRWGTFSR